MVVFRISPARHFSLLRRAVPRQAPLRIFQPSPARLLQASPARFGFWETGYNTPSRQKIGMKYWGLFYFWAVVSGPTFMIMLGNYPGLLAWFADKMRPVEYPPQADPTIIKTIYKNQVPKKSSMESYRKEGSKHPEANDYAEKTLGTEGEAEYYPQGHFKSDQEVKYLNEETIKKPASEFMKPIRNFPDRVLAVEGYK